MSSFGKDSAQLEREIEEQRQRIEDRVGEIRQRLSPGQLVDEVLSYTKNGGQQFASNLGSTIASKSAAGSSAWRQPHLADFGAGAQSSSTARPAPTTGTGQSRTIPMQRCRAVCVG